MNYKICKVYNILDKMISCCRNTIEEKLNNSFENVDYSIELLQKIVGHNKFVKILMFFKYFKSIINKYFKISSKNKKLEYFNLNNLNEDLDFLSRKMDVLEKSIPNLSSKNSTLSFKSNNSNTDSLINPYNFYYPLSETNFAIYPQSSITNLDL
jgi:prefoldin subunit 5